MSMGDVPRSRRLLDGLAVTLAVLVSMALIQFATGEPTVTLAFLGGLTVLGLITYAASRHRPVPAVQQVSDTPDWSVTVAAIEQPGQAIAITDRANRLVCANSAFEGWFGSLHAPPKLAIEDGPRCLA